jgi:hypothetical protein
MLNRFFGNSREKLVLSLLDDGISAEELARLRDAIRNASPDREPTPDAAVSEISKKRGGR